MKQKGEGERRLGKGDRVKREIIIGKKLNFPDMSSLELKAATKDSSTRYWPTISLGTKTVGSWFKI